MFVAISLHAYPLEFGKESYVVTGCLATLGWLYTNYANLRNAQRAHTMNVLLQMRTNTVLHEHKINMFTRYPEGVPVRPQDVPILVQEMADVANYNMTSSARKIAIYESIKYQLNLMEFICVGMMQGDLDEHTIRLTLRGVIVKLYEHCEPIIIRSSKSNPKIYENLNLYYKKFKNEYAREKKKGLLFRFLRRGEPAAIAVSSAANTPSTPATPGGGAPPPSS